MIEEYDGTWRNWRSAWGVDPTLTRYGYDTCNCDDCKNFRKSAWRKWKANEVYKTSAVINELKRSMGVDVVERMFDLPKLYAQKWADLTYINPAYFAPTPKFDLMGGTFYNEPKTATASIPKHKRKATKKVTKQTMNEAANEHASEANDMIAEAQDLLKAADVFEGKRIFDVVVNVNDWNSRSSVTIIFERIDADADQALSEDFEDKTLMYAYKNGMTMLAARMRGALQQSGRKLLLDTTLSMHRLVAPEMAQAVAAENAAKMEANVGQAQGLSVPSVQEPPASAVTKKKAA